MFDVSWTDPSRETVGQRKNRKDQESNGISRASSVRSSRSSDSTPAPIRPSLFNLFNGSKKESLHRSGSQSKLSSFRGEHPSKPARRLSSYTVSSHSSQQEAPEETAATRGGTRIPVNGSSSRGSSYNTDAGQSSSSEVAESVFSGWTGCSAATESSCGSAADATSAKGQIVQPLSPNSFVTQSTEVTVSPRDSVKACEQVATIVHISSTGTMPLHVQESPTKQFQDASLLDIPVLNSPHPENASTDVPGKEAILQTDIWPVEYRGRQPDPWRPPQAWGCSSEEAVAPRVISPKSTELPVRPSSGKKQKSKSLTQEMTHLQRSIRRMEAASPKIVLERLKEEWTGVADASVYRELEVEKQLWMLSALRSIIKTNSTGAPDESRPAAVLDKSPASTKLLSLYQNHASTSVLSAQSPNDEIHHLSTSPLSPSLYLNVHPLSVPGPTAQLPYASNIFSSIHTFSLAALLPASSIPTILKECNRVLTPCTRSTSPQPFSHDSPPAQITVKPGGSLHLTILDPSPLPATLGPRLRTWLEDHLILNLEKQFRCINPSRLLPIWLDDAGLRAEGSTITCVRFLAAVAPDHGYGYGMDDDGGEGVKQELKSVVGRMLWKEMWGSFVQGEKWWWEDENVIEECERIGTVWEYAVIEAVKEG